MLICSSRFPKVSPMPPVADNSFQAVQFELVADAEPGLMSRLVAPFARRDLVPDRVRTGRNGALIEAILAVDEMPSEMVHLIENNLRQIVGVRSLTVVLRKMPRQVA
jgi:hypothetical protein